MHLSCYLTFDLTILPSAYAKPLLIVKKRALDFLTYLLCSDLYAEDCHTSTAPLLPGQDQRAILMYYTAWNCNSPLLYNLHSWWNMHSLGTYYLSVIHYLVLTPSQTQRCQYCHYNAPSSQGLILYFTVKKTSLPASARVMFLSHTNSSLSRCAIYLSHSHEGCCSPSLSSGHRARFTGRTDLYRCCLGDTQPLGNGTGFKLWNVMYGHSQ